MMSRLSRLSRLATALALAGAGGCGRAESAPAPEGGGPPASPAASSAPPTGRVIEVRMVTEDRGSHFEPAAIEARAGDVLRFVLVSGVHNASFTAPGAAAAALPATELLQLPGQTADVPLTFGAGTFGFQCDPHAALGMVGTVTVK